MCRILSLIWLLMTSCLVMAASDYTAIVVPVEWTVREQPRASSRALLYLPAGEKVYVGKDSGSFRKIRYKREGKWQIGYVSDQDFDRPAAERFVRNESWGAGGGLLYSKLVQGARTFITEDQVRYQTTDYESTTTSPFILVQFERKNFWRVIGTWRRVLYKSVATTDVAGTSAKEIVLSHNFLSVAMQRAWTPFKNDDRWYVAGGVEFARATTANLTLGGLEITTTDENLPMYFGIQAIVGGQFSHTKSLSSYVEARYLMVPNQSPVVLGMEAAAGVIYWPGKSLF